MRSESFGCCADRRLCPLYMKGKNGNLRRVAWVCLSCCIVHTNALFLRVLGGKE